MGAKSKRKGKVGELEAAREVSRLLHCECRRGVQYQGGDESPDIQADIPQLHFEVKRCEKFDLYGAMHQACEECGDKLPVVLHRRNAHEWVAVVRLDDLPRLAQIVYLTLAQQ